MSFGPRYNIPHTIDGQGVTVVMRKAHPSDAAALAELSDHTEVLDFIRMNGSQTVQDEEEFLERIRTDTNVTAWVVAVQEGDKPEVVVGVTELRISGEPGQVTTGIVLHPDWWGKGLASLTHHYRTWYAFCQLGVQMIRSSYVDANIGSGKALAGVGYVEFGRLPKSQLVNGAWYDEVFVAAYSPAHAAVLWPADEVPANIMAGIERTEQTLEYVRGQLSPR